MDQKIVNIIGYIAGSSYLALGGLYIVLALVFGWLSISDPLVLKGIPWLVIYVASLFYLAKTENQSTHQKFKIWFSSFVIHVLLLVFILVQLGNDSIYLMVPEFAILALHLLAIGGLLFKNAKA